MKKFLRYFLIILSIAIILILVYASIDKLLKLNLVATSPDSFGTNSIDYFYRDHVFLAYLHIIPGLLFLGLGGYQLIPFFRRKNYKIHRFVGKVFLLLSAIIFVTAIVLAVFVPFGDWLETITTIIFGIFLLYCVYKAYDTAISKKFILHRNWVIRIYFVALSVSTIRGIIALSDAVYGIPIKNSFGMAFLLAFIIHTIVVEIYLKFLIKEIRL